MVLPDTVVLCDAVELAALAIGKPLSDKDVAKQFFPAQNMSEVEGDLHDVFQLCRTRQAACGGGYPFEVSEKSIAFTSFDSFNTYLFLLLGCSLDFGGPLKNASLLETFRDKFEDVVGWALRKAGFVTHVLSIPRSSRGLPKKLAPALRQIATDFAEPAVLIEANLMPNDNDLDVDVLAVPIKGNGDRGGWPVFQIQCATGTIAGLESKVSEGAQTFGTVWDKGFFLGSRLRGAATPDDLILLHETYWLRLCVAGWILDRTRIVHLASGAANVPVPGSALAFWDRLWKVRNDISWQTGWQKAA